MPENGTPCTVHTQAKLILGSSVRGPFIEFVGFSKPLIQCCPSNVNIAKNPASVGTPIEKINGEMCHVATFFQDYEMGG